MGIRRRRGMRIGVFHGSPYYLRFYEETLAVLAERGHTLVLAAPAGATVRVPAALRGSKRIRTALHPTERGDGMTELIRLSRTARDTLRFFEPSLAGAHANKERAVRRLAQALSVEPDEVAAAGESLSPTTVRTAMTALAHAERHVPPDPTLVEFVRSQRLDVAVVISRFNIGSMQTDIVKSAGAAGVPCGVVAYSWDNLSNKGLMHAAPDRLFVWNAIQRDEAVQLHGLPVEDVVVTGAPRFDRLFASPPRPDRSALLRDIGLDPARRVVLYVGSSSFVAPREPEFVDKWLAAVRRAPEPDAASANVIVRPHPNTAKEGGAWRAWAERPRPEGVALAGGGFEPDQDLLDQIVVSDAVVGLNTSAELEAAILDKPVLTVSAGDLAPGQEGSVHFRYLLEGGVLAAATLTEHVDQLARALRDDPSGEARRRFVEAFIRPRGVDVPVSPTLADEITALARS
jgi:hypothetical protein